jgi:hypothetical protein
VLLHLGIVGKWVEYLRIKQVKFTVDEGGAGIVWEYLEHQIA